MQVPITDEDPNEEEDDGLDEAICPCDMVRPYTLYPYHKCHH